MKQPEPDSDQKSSNDSNYSLIDLVKEEYEEPNVIVIEIPVPKPIIIQSIQ